MTQPSASTKRVFVVGCPRSGTTWMLHLLSHHPAVAGIQQGGLFFPLSGMEEWWLASEEGSLSRRIVAPNLASESAGSSASSRGLKETLPAEAWYAALRRVATVVSDAVASAKPGASVVVDHTPEQLRLAHLILAIFPDAYFLHVVRDPRGVLGSRLAARRSWSRGFSSNPLDFAEEWLRDLCLAGELRERTDRYAEVRYEDLLADGPAQLAAILAWLDLPASPDLCARIFAACGIERMRESVAAPPQFFRTGAAESWRSELSRSQIRLVEQMCGEAMERKAYLPCLRPSRIPSAAAIWRAKRAVRRLAVRLGASIRRAAPAGADRPGRS